MGRGVSGLLMAYGHAPAGGNDGSTKLLLHFDGTNGSTSFPDSSAFGNTATAGGNAQISTAQSKFGGASALFDGTGDKITVTPEGNFDFGSGDFSIDFWFRTTNAAATQLLTAKHNTGGFGPFAVFLIGGVLQLYASSTGSSWDIINAATIGTPSSNVWYHCAVTRTGGVIYRFMDGVSGGTTSTSATLVGNATNLVLGNYADAGTGASGVDYTGYIDEYRISTTARWTANFTPPAVAYS